MAVMDDGVKARVRLWLRSERAFGLGSLPAPDFSTSSEPETGATSVARPEPMPVRTVVNANPERLDVGKKRVGNPLCSMPEFDSSVLATEEKKRLLEAMDNNEVKSCPRCRLCETRTQTVFGEGDVDAKIFFIGEGPGETEDQTGRPFVGRAGQLLDKMIAAMGLSRQQVYIANIVKCRPPANRAPAPDETAACTPYLLRQLEIVRPKVIVTLGLPASQYMLGSTLAMGKLRGQWHTWRGIKLMPTYHPSFVLRAYTPQNRAAVWGDLKLVMNELGMKEPKRSEGTV